MTSPSTNTGKKAATKSSTKRNRTAALTEISPTLGCYRTSDAIDALLDLHNRVDLIPALGYDQILDTLDKIRVVAAENRLTTVLDLATHAGAVITQVSGVGGDLTRFMKSADAEPTHHVRNVLLAVQLAAALSIHAEIKPVCEAAPVLQKRSTHTVRPLHDDEIVLTRLRALVVATGSAKDLRAAGTYVLSDIGLTAGETAEVRADDIDEDAATVLAPGNARLHARYLPVTRFGTVILDALLTNHRTTGFGAASLLTYRPDSTADRRSALDRRTNGNISAHGVLTRQLETVGLTQADITPASIHLWRVNTAHLEAGNAAAHHVSGRRTLDKTLELLDPGRRTAPNANTDAKKITSFL
jgi:hypothetical protein